MNNSLFGSKNYSLQKHCCLVNQIKHFSVIKRVYLTTIILLKTLLNKNIKKSVIRVHRQPIQRNHTKFNLPKNIWFVRYSEQ